MKEQLHFRGFVTHNNSILFSQANFLGSCLEKTQFPSLYVQRGVPYPEIAIIGRSNAGKSSVIQHLTQKKNLVHISATPGKTQTINFFNIDDKLLLVDLPGYGFAKIPKELKKTWGERLSQYLEDRNQLKLVILVLDLRRSELSEEDLQMIAWAKFYNKKILFLSSKSDKLSSSERKIAETKRMQTLKNLMQTEDLDHLSYSIKDNPCRISLKSHISHMITL
jgi:GTP-binding protein